MNQMQQINYEGLKKQLLLEVLPAVTVGRSRENSAGSLESVESNEDASLTLKYGLTSKLTLDGTINPDFSQVESDAGQVDFNQRFALFYPEMRPFFIEGHDYFNFAGVSGGNPVGSVVHTRTIVNPVAGLKLTGKVSDKTTVASIFATDDLYDDTGGDYAQFGILRVKQALDQDSYFGGIFTDRERDHGFNRVAGLDGQFRLNQSTTLTGHVLLSNTDDDLDSEINDASGQAFALNINHNNRDRNISIGFRDLSSDFMSESGYVTRTDNTRVGLSYTPKFYPENPVIQRIDFPVQTRNIYDKPSTLWENHFAANVVLVMPRRSRISVGYNNTTEIYLGEKFRTNGLAATGNSQITKEFYFRFFIGRQDMIRYEDDPYQGYGHDFSANFVYQPSDNFRSSMNYTYTDFYRKSGDEKIFDYSIVRSWNTYQFNRYLFFRGILEYNSFREDLLTDFLLSFTYIPGTVLHIGYGSLYEKQKWDGINQRFIDASGFHEMKRGLFFKTSYLWRL
ncbi:DUF5916 domain-containing protein [candidate division KSB1 bacterium]